VKKGDFEEWGHLRKWTLRKEANRKSGHVVGVT